MTTLPNQTKPLEIILLKQARKNLTDTYLRFVNLFVDSLTPVPIQNPV